MIISTEREASVHAVSPFEADLLNVLYTILGERPLSVHLPKFTLPRDRPTHIGSTAAGLVRAALAKGMTSWLVRSGGWRSERFLTVSGEVTTGRVWERHTIDELTLDFSIMTLDFLMWLTSAATLDAGAAWRPVAPLTLGDELLILRTVHLLRNTPLGAKWLSMRHMLEIPLIGLFFHDSEISGRVRLRFDFSNWITGPGAGAKVAVLECLQGPLADRFVQIELQRSFHRDPDRVQRTGRLQACVLQAYLDACRTSGRTDLARFLLNAAHRLFARPELTDAFGRNIDVSNLRMVQRTEIYNAASTFHRTVLILQDWAKNFSTVGYFDDGFAAAQLWMSDWERYDGQKSADQASSVLRDHNIVLNKESLL